MRSVLLLAAALAAALVAVADARMLRQIGTAGLQGYAGDRGGFGADNQLAYGASGFSRRAVITGDASGTSDIGQIQGDKNYGETQAAAYARGVAGATGYSAMGFQVSLEKEGGNMHSAAGDAIRRQAGYQGTSFAGDIFDGSAGFDDSTAGRAIRRTGADNAALQQRIQQRSTTAYGYNPTVSNAFQGTYGINGR